MNNFTRSIAGSNLVVSTSIAMRNLIGKALVLTDAQMNGNNNQFIAAAEGAIASNAIPPKQKQRFEEILATYRRYLKPNISSFG